MNYNERFNDNVKFLLLLAIIWFCTTLFLFIEEYIF